LELVKIAFCFLLGPLGTDVHFISPLNIQADPSIRRFSYRRFTVARKKFGKSKNKGFTSFKTRAKGERAVTW
jgi:hypothetical protein